MPVDPARAIVEVTPSRLVQFSPLWPKARNCGTANAVAPPISTRPRTPGAAASSDEMLARAVGMVSSTSRVSWVLVDVDVTSTGAWPETVMVSETDPTVRVTSSLPRSPP